MTENELSWKIIGQAIKIHNQLGPGLLESVYQECLCYQLIQQGLLIERQKPIPLVYKDVILNCGFRCDILVENKIVVEIKSVEALNEIHMAQVLTYLKLTEVKVGLLINFNVTKLKMGIKRIVNQY